MRDTQWRTKISHARVRLSWPHLFSGRLPTTNVRRLDDEANGHYLLVMEKRKHIKDHVVNGQCWGRGPWTAATVIGWASRLPEEKGMTGAPLGMDEADGMAAESNRLGLEPWPTLPSILIMKLHRPPKNHYCFFSCSSLYLHEAACCGHSCFAFCCIILPVSPVTKAEVCNDSQEKQRPKAPMEYGCNVFCSLWRKKISWTRFYLPP